MRMEQKDLKMLALKTGLMWPQVKEWQKLLDAGRGREQILPGALVAQLPPIQPSDAEIGLFASRTVRG